MVLEETLESPLNSKEIKPVNHKGDQPWIFTVRTDAEVETPILLPPDVKSQLPEKDPEAGKDWRQDEKRVTEMWWFGGVIDSMHVSLSQLQEMVKDKGSCYATVYWVAKIRTWQWLKNNKILNIVPCALQ